MMAFEAQRYYARPDMSERTELSEGRSLILTQRERRPMVEDGIGRCIIDLAVQIHRETGAGLLFYRLVE